MKSLYPSYFHPYISFNLLGLIVTGSSVISVCVLFSLFTPFSHCLHFLKSQEVEQPSSQLLFVLVAFILFVSFASSS